MTVVAAALLFGLIGYAIPSNMLLPLLSSLEASYHISAVAAIWISLIALLSGAAFIPTLCRLGDTMGWKKQLAIAGLACLTLGALIAAVSSSLPLLLVGRAISGIGLVLFPMLAGIVNDEFPMVRRKVAISLISATLFLGLGVGGVVAGLLVEHHGSFRIVFWGAAALSFLGLIVIALLVPGGRGRPPGAPAQWWRAVDPFGAVGFAIPAIALDIAFSEEPTWGWGSWPVIFLIVIAVVVAIAWVLVERRVASPMVDQSVFWSRPMWVNNAVAILTGFGLFGALVATSTFAQLPHVPGLDGLGASTVVGAWVIVPTEWAILITGPVTGYLSRRTGKGPFLFRRRDPRRPRAAARHRVPRLAGRAGDLHDHRGRRQRHGGIVVRPDLRGGHPARARRPPVRHLADPGDRRRRLDRRCGIRRVPDQQHAAARARCPKGPSAASVGRRLRGLLGAGRRANPARRRVRRRLPCHLLVRAAR
jgi:MFS family permease